jgi:ABC-type glucose/galactose transport system permease subunit
MVEALIALLVVCVVVAVVASVILYCVALLPVEPQFQQIIRMLVILIAALIILFKALPLLGVHI